MFVAPPPPHLLAPVSPAGIIETPSYHKRPIAAVDIETYRNYWLWKLMRHSDRCTIEFDMYPGKSLDVDGIRQAMQEYTVVTFNGMNYDIPMITLAMAGADCETMKMANDLIIPGGGSRGLAWWEFYRHFNLENPMQDNWRTGHKAWLDHIDLIEMAPGVRVSLKTYGGRLNSRKLQDLPIEPDAYIEPEQRGPLSEYCGNDLHTTLDLYERTIDRLELRAAIGAEFDIDVRSKSDAQAAEAVFKKEMGFEVQKPFWQHGTRFKYEPPSFIQFTTPELQAVLETARTVDFVLSDKDQTDDIVDPVTEEKIKTGIMMPKELKGAAIKIGSSIYRMGIGGLHSSESHVCHIADEATELYDIDATSFYPSIMLRLGKYPNQTGPRFLEILKQLLDSRVHAKRQMQRCAKEIKTLESNPDVFFEVQDVVRGLKTEIKVWDAKQGGYKIMINGTFGKTGNKWSIVFSPDLLIQTTITGQLSLLMLIEMLEQCGIPVVSANTDGIVAKCPKSMKWAMDACVALWEKRTGFFMESAQYKALYSRDVNNYIAVKMDGKCKTKGVFGDAGLSKSPGNGICATAVVNYITSGKLPAETIRECEDIRQFLTIRTVAGGAMKGQIYLGKSVRWYAGKNEMGALHYKNNGNQVAGSEGAVPMMELEDDYFPSDLDHDFYIRKAYSMLGELGLKG